MRVLLLLCLSFLLPISLVAQNDTIQQLEVAPMPVVHPKLVVGIVVDQMRSDYLEKYWDGFGEAGFKRLINEGFWCKNTQYNYMPTHTGPGHASIFTGTTPAVHGIISNDWYDPQEGQVVYCASDVRMKPVGAPALFGTFSPHRLKSSTLGDQVKLATFERGKTIGISIKDRGAVLPVGPTADYAFWFDGATGRFVTSTWYANELPAWVQTYNAKERPLAFIDKGWNLHGKGDTYTNSLADVNPYEAPFMGQMLPQLPYALAELAPSNGGYAILKTTPGGSSLVAELAQEAIVAEALGKDDDVDLLTVSFSSPDMIGHRFGGNSRELEDAYRWLDRDIEQLLATLDAEVGAGNYTVFLTADHGAAPVPKRLTKLRIPSGYYSNLSTTGTLNQHLTTILGGGPWITSVTNDNIYFNKDVADKKVTMERVAEETRKYMLAQPGVAQVFSKEELLTGYFTNPIYNRVKNGVHQHRSGDLLVVMEPGWMVGAQVGTSHGSPYAYDAHVPLVWMGAGIKHGSTTQLVDITDIAPTVAILAGLQYPNGCIGQPIVPLLDQ